MANILGEETKTEILVRKFLFAQGFRFRKNVKSLPGKPDIVLPKYRTVIFINGCFWHGHKNCTKAALPETNFDFWEKKILQNSLRDRHNIELIEKQGWQVCTICQCELKNKIIAQNTLKEIIIKILNNYLK